MKQPRSEGDANKPAKNMLKRPPKKEIKISEWKYGSNKPKGRRHALDVLLYTCTNSILPSQGILHEHPLIKLNTSLNPTNKDINTYNRLYTNSYLDYTSSLSNSGEYKPAYNDLCLQKWVGYSAFAHLHSVSYLCKGLVDWIRQRLAQKLVKRVKV